MSSWHRHLETSRAASGRHPGVVGLARSGVTLMELMIVLVILGIVLAATYPTIVDQIKNRESFEAARAVTQAIKQQRIRAQNLNRAVGVMISAANNNVVGYVSIDNQCANLVLDQPVTLLDVTAEYDDAMIYATSEAGNWLENVICIRPDGRVLSAATGLPFADGADKGTNDLGGSLRFEVGRADGKGRNFVVRLPFNGIARLE